MGRHLMWIVSKYKEIHRLIKMREDWSDRKTRDRRRWLQPAREWQSNLLLLFQCLIDRYADMQTVTAIVWGQNKHMHTILIIPSVCTLTDRGRGGDNMKETDRNEIWWQKRTKKKQKSVAYQTKERWRQLKQRKSACLLLESYLEVQKMLGD